MFKIWGLGFVHGICSILLQSESEGLGILFLRAYRVVANFGHVVVEASRSGFQFGAVS